LYGASANSKAIVPGVDFGTLSVRVWIVDSARGLLATALAEYPLHREREDPEFATQFSAAREAVRKAGMAGDLLLAQKRHQSRFRDIYFSRSRGPNRSVFNRYCPRDPRKASHGSDDR
jgi:hypothetical protein